MPAISAVTQANAAALAELWQYDECLFDSQAAPVIDGGSLSMVAVDDVLNWLAVYSQQD